jgi:copper oxidase (laccase) domain-containing protein
MHIHYTPQTRHYLNAEAFAKMKPGMRVLNLSRGELVDDDAMIAALGEETAMPYLDQRGIKWQVDLAGLNRQWLLHAGLTPEHIDVCGICTACHPEWFWSHRKMGSARGLQVAMITLPKEVRP